MITNQYAEYNAVLDFKVYASTRLNVVVYPTNLAMPASLVFQFGPGDPISSVQMASSGVPAIAPAAPS